MCKARGGDWSANVGVRFLPLCQEAGCQSRRDVGLAILYGPDDPQQFWSTASLDDVATDAVLQRHLDMVLIFRSGQHDGFHIRACPLELSGSLQPAARHADI